MGISGSSRRRDPPYFHNPPQLPSPYYYPAESPPPPPPAPQGYYYTSTSPYTMHNNSYVSYPPLSPPPQTEFFSYSNVYSSCSNYSNSMLDSVHYNPYYENHAIGWPAIDAVVGTVVSTPPYVDHRTAKRIRNDVNVHRDTLQLEVDEQNPDQHLVSFIFDAFYDGRPSVFSMQKCITILYFAKEEENCRLVPLFPDVFVPIRVSFQKGVGQKFCQPSGTGINLGFFELDGLSKPSLGEDAFPLVICAETCLTTSSAVDNLGDPMLDVFPHMQITEAIVEKGNIGSPFQVKVDRQILWTDGLRYELKELYGIGGSAAAGFDDNDTGKECVICMTEPKDTAVLPCRHMCMCGECAQALWLQSNKCPICRQPIEELIQIKINNGDYWDIISLC
ncbi:putative E3 ubiquitin-protein ligase LUL4 [Senna tora]|uniref:RING-type E3 ubiquitin transferase n=1 Tax=Senna tora TaxID=362788 RepID=A0A834WE16_9FABA|nr:putative E3 ubiquitin-protein ligase LUL4 [Senna tora]